MVGIVFLLNIEYAPYLQKYRAELDKQNVKYEIVTWNRLDSEISTNQNIIAYDKKSSLGDGKVRKLIDFIGFRKFLIKTIQHRKYNKLIVLTTLTGVVINDFLVKNYKNNFIFDIRDYTFEKSKIFRLIEKRVIDASSFTSISSEGFKSFLPKSDKYVVSHNIILEEVNDAKNFTLSRDSVSNKVNLTFLGAVRHFDVDKKVADIFGTDNRFLITYHGYGVSYEKFRKYCQEKERNVELTGKYNRNDKLNLMKNVDIINAYYHENTFANRFALPNKYYDALIYKIPIWANPKLYVGERAISKGIGLNVELNRNSADNLYSTYKNFDWDKFYTCCENELKEVLNEDKIFRERLENFILN